MGAGAAVAGTAQPTPVPGGVYTDTQARQGGVLYAAHCAQCHGQDLAGVEQAPALAGAAFREKWKGATLDRLFDRVVSMPPAQPNSLSGGQYAAILAYLLQRECAARRHAALAADRSALANVVFNTAPLAPPGRPAASPGAVAAAPAPAERRGPGAAVPPVEWKTYGGDLASQRYSPLDQIDAQNFSKLQIAWRLNTNFLGPRPDSLYSATPLMVGGVLYTTAGTRRAVVALARPRARCSGCTPKTKGRAA